MVVGIAVWGTALAAIPDAGGVIHGCYLKVDGGLRVIDTEAGQTCRSAETELAWNQTGPQGPQGEPGPHGPKGPQGPEGPQGPRDLKVLLVRQDPRVHQDQPVS